LKVYAELFVSLQDKPERCGSMLIALGSGAFSARWRHSCNYNALSHVLPSGGSCYETNKHATAIGSLSNDTIPEESHCRLCLYWDAGKYSDIGYFKAPEICPLTETLIPGKYLKENIAAFEGLTKTWKKTHTTLMSGNWE
jgi:hypothetical protein